jgi:hypothetical protein
MDLHMLGPRISPLPMNGSKLVFLGDDSNGAEPALQQRGP